MLHTVQIIFVVCLLNDALGVQNHVTHMQQEPIIQLQITPREAGKQTATIWLLQITKYQDNGRHQTE